MGEESIKKFSRESSALRWLLKRANNRGLESLRGHFELSHSMTSERCLSACADTQTGLPAAVKVGPLIDYQTNIRQRGYQACLRATHRQARSWLLGEPPPVLSRPEGQYRRAENARTARHDPPLLLACVYAQEP